MLARLIRAQRLKRNWSQQTLAERAGVALSIVTRIEQGRTRRPKEKNLRKLCKALRLSYRRLLENAK